MYRLTLIKQSEGKILVLEQDEDFYFIGHPQSAAPHQKHSAFTCCVCALLIYIFDYQLYKSLINEHFKIDFRFHDTKD